MRVARLEQHLHNKPRFRIHMTGKIFYILTDSSELEIGTCHTYQGHTFTVQHKL